MEIQQITRGLSKLALKLFRELRFLDCGVSSFLSKDILNVGIMGTFANFRAASMSQSFRLCHTTK